MSRSKSAKPGDMPMVAPGAAPIDIGSTMHMAPVNPDADDRSVRAFGTFTCDLQDMARWFKACGVTSVAMDAAGAYWIPAFEVLEPHGFQVILVNARYIKNVPGRKSAVDDAAWLQRLHSYGPLRGSFRPNAEVATLRAYMRQRERLIEYSASVLDRINCSMVGLKMPRAIEVVDECVSRLDRGEITALEAVEQLLLEELTFREERRIRWALRMGRVNTVKTLAGYDFSSQPSFDKARIMALAESKFVARAEVLHLLGPTDPTTKYTPHYVIENPIASEPSSVSA